MGGGQGGVTETHRPKHCWPLDVLERFSANSGCCWVSLTGAEPVESSPSGRQEPGGGREEPGAREPWGPQDTAAQGHGGSPCPLPGTHTCRGTKAELFSEDGEPEAEAQPVRMKRTPLSPRRQEGRPGPSPGASQLPTPGPAPSLRSSLRPPRVPPRATGGQACSWAGAHDTLRKEGPPGLKSRGSTGDAKRRLGRGEGVLVIKGGREGPVPRGDRCKCTGETAVVSQGIRSSLPPCHPE